MPPEWPGPSVPVTGEGNPDLKQAAWRDGWDEVAVDADARGFTAWYGRGETIVGVLTHERDLDYEAGRRMVRAAVPGRSPAPRRAACP